MINYALTRYSATPKNAFPKINSSSGKIDNFTTIGTHPYQGIYNPGSLDYVDNPTTGCFDYDDNAIRIRLTMDEPAMPLVMEKSNETDFLNSDFVSLNFINTDNKIVQVIIKPNGKSRLINIEEDEVDFEVGTDASSWSLDIKLTWSAFGMSASEFEKYPIPFDAVRFQGASGVVSSWAMLPDQLPFNEPYEFPVFHFGLLSAAPIEWKNFVNTPISDSINYTGPSEIMVGSYTSLSFVYKVGAQGLAPNGALLFNIGNEVIECNRRSTTIRHLPEKDWSPLQWNCPNEAGYVTVQTAEGDAPFSLERNRHFSVTARYTGETALPPGTEILLKIGTHGPGVRSQLLSQNNYPFKFYIDPLGNGAYLPLQFPQANIVARPATSFVLHASSTPETGVPFLLKVVAIDSFGNIATNHIGEFSLHAPHPLSVPSDTCRFESQDQGVKHLTISIEEKDAFVIRVIDKSDSSINGTSELIVTDGRFGSKKIVFGDTHTHTRLSDGRLHPFDKYREVADHRGLDFWAITDHDFDITQERFELLEETMEHFNSPGEFATIPAYEWSPNMGQQTRWDCEKTPGHRNIFFKKMPKRIYDGIRSESNTPQKLKAVLEKEEPDNHLIISHFHCGDPTIVPEVDDCVEVSGWCGNFNRERRGNTNDIGGKYSVVDAYELRSGFGVTAGTDHGTEAYYTGLPAEMTALYCDTLDREHVFDALRSGTIYASSGQKVLLKFTVDGIEPKVGSSPLKTNAPRAINIVVGSAKPVIQVALLRNGEILRNFPGYAFGVKEFSFSDDEQLDAGYYYVRIHTAQGHLTWSSPIWFLSSSVRALSSLNL